MKRLVILAALILPACASTQSVTDNPVSSGSPENINISEIYTLDQKVRGYYQEQAVLRAKVLTATKENRLEEAKEFSDQSNKLARDINELEIQLNGLMDRHQFEWQSQNWYQKFIIEAGPQYTYFDNNLDITDGIGSRFRIHLCNEELKRVHTYPLISVRDAPLRKVIASSPIMEFRSSLGKTTVNAKEQTATINTGLAGLGIAGEIGPDLYLGLSLMAGGQQYNNTSPEDIAPVISYATGLYQYLSQKSSLGIGITEDIVWTNATQVDEKTRTFYNFSITFLLRIRL